MPGGDYREALPRARGLGRRAGPVVDADGATIGRHGGAAAYTVGQRKGLGVAVGEPRYVSRIDPTTNTITLGRRRDLETRNVALDDVSFVAGEPPGGATSAFRAAVRIRHRAAPVPATVRPAANRGRRGDRRWAVETDQPVWAAAPGQAAVLYDGEIVLGGGRIART